MELDYFSKERNWYEIDLTLIKQAHIYKISNMTDFWTCSWILEYPHLTLKALETRNSPQVSQPQAKRHN